ncbi:DUF2218 domain-containing protein [Nocardia wallacei]|uniref:DUF2218 domain-containing protein n=1 Tax=Nocardia wallacei TaxID=480035 RepID=UPI002456C28A|nr:DUF2218 domain-containing protein [Nocardia wallacei]
MPTVEAHVRTDRPVRFLRQFCKHADAMSSPRAHRMRMHQTSPALRGDVRLRIEHTDTSATIHFEPWGTCLLRIDTQTLVIRIEAVDKPALHRIRDIVTHDLQRLGHGEPTIEWDEHDASGGAAS